MKKFNLFLYGSLLVLIGAGVAYSQDPKIGYVDRVKIFSQLESWSQAEQALARMTESAQAEIREILAEADSLGRVLENQLMLTETARTQIQNRLAQLNQDYQRIGSQRQQELLARENDLKAPIFESFDKVVTDIGIQEGYLLIYDKAAGAVIFAAGGRDLTEQVLFELRKLEK